MEGLPSLLLLVRTDAAPDLPLNIYATPRPASAATSKEVPVIGVGWFKWRHHNPAIVVLAGLNHQVALRQVLEDFRQVSAAI